MVELYTFNNVQVNWNTATLCNLKCSHFLVISLAGFVAFFSTALLKRPYCICSAWSQSQLD